MDFKSKANYKKPYLNDEEFMEQIEREDELSFKLIDDSVSDEKCFICNVIVDIKKADKIIVDFKGGRLKNFPSGTITDYFCHECEAVLCGHTEIKEN